MYVAMLPLHSPASTTRSGSYMSGVLSRKQASVAAIAMVAVVVVALTALTTGDSWAVAVVILLQGVLFVALLTLRQQVGRLRKEGPERIRRDVVQPIVDAMGVERLQHAKHEHRLDEAMTRLDADTRAFQQDMRLRFLQVATDTWAIQNLLRLVDVKGEFPPAGGWAATPQTLLAMVSEVQSRTGDVLMVECGSGTSTVWMAATMRQRGAGRVVAVEHEEEFAEETRRHLRRNGLEEWAEVRAAPLAPLTLGEQTFDWYDLSCFGGLAPIDILFVDGPPFRTGELARYPAVPALVQRLAPDALVVLDDVGRAQEREVAKRWLREEHGGRRLERTRRLDRSQMFRVVS